MDVTNKRVEPLSGFASGTAMLGAMRELAKECEQHDPHVTFRGLKPRERQKLRDVFTVVIGWMEEFE